MKPLSLVILLSTALGALASKAAEKPNIILIMADDIGYECYGCYGSEQYQTPHIDRLAANGIRFEHCYSQPLCTPSRVKIMTGISNVRNYSGFSILNSNQKTFAHYLRDAGYRTMIGGKWQLLAAEHYKPEFREKGSWPLETGFDRACLWQVDKLGDRFWNPLLYIDDKANKSEQPNRQYTPDDYGPDIVVEEFGDFMADASQADAPFFLYYPMILVHNPFLPTPHSESRNNKDKQKNFEDMVSYMDHLIGRIVEKTEELGIDKNTLILVTGDNGTNSAITSKLGDRVIKGGKGKTTDAGTRVALVGYWPNTIPAGTVCGDLVDFSDFVPTFQEVAGAPIPEGLDGRSFLPQLKGEKGNPRDWIFCYYNPRPEKTEPTRFVRDQRWKLYGNGKFYDVANDPLEETVVRNKDAPDEAKAARKKLKAALESFPAEGQTLLQFSEAP